jgi:hypothetical protein
MTINLNWLEPKEKSYFHQISLECIVEIAVFMEDIDTEKRDCDTCLIVQEILSDEIEDEATEIFENMRVALINTKEREKELEGSKKKGKKL